MCIHSHSLYPAIHHTANSRYVVVGVDAIPVVLLSVLSYQVDAVCCVVLDAVLCNRDTLSLHVIHRSTDCSTLGCIDTGGPAMQSPYL